MSTAAADIPRPRFERMYLSAAPRAEKRGATKHFGFAAQRFEPSIPHILGRARRA